MAAVGVRGLPTPPSHAPSGVTPLSIPGPRPANQRARTTCLRARALFAPARPHAIKRRRVAGPGNSSLQRGGSATGRERTALMGVHSAQWIVARRTGVVMLSDPRQIRNHAAQCPRRTRQSALCASFANESWGVQGLVQRIRRSASLARGRLGSTHEANMALLLCFCGGAHDCLCIPLNATTEANTALLRS